MTPYTYADIELHGKKGIEITGYSGSEKKLFVPSAIDGLPVLSIGKHAFTDANAGLCEITLPESVLCIRAFAFYFCPDLTRLTLTDSVIDYYDGALRTCSGVSEIDVTLTMEHSELVHRILEDSDRRVRVSFHFKDEAHTELCLVFPSYNDNSISDPRAQTFHIKIEGSGFSYRECVRQNGLLIKEYDSLFRKAVADDIELAADIAIARLKCPAWLSETSADMYKAHLRRNIMRVTELAFLPGNDDWLDVLIQDSLLDAAALDLSLQTASSLRQTALVSRLMDYRRNKLNAPRDKVLSLDEFSI